MSGEVTLSTVMAICIAQLRNNATVFGGRVAGAAEFTRGLRDYTTSLALPAAYVLPLGYDAEPNRGMGSTLQQVLHKHIGIAVEIDAQRDRRGQDPAMQLEEIEAQINASVLNLFIPGCRMSTGIYAVGFRSLPDLDRARSWWQWEYGLDWQITDEDGVQPNIIGDLQIEVLLFGPHGVPAPGTPPVADIVVPSPPIIPPTDGNWPEPSKENAT